ncbi:MAG: hypothetical protein U0821_22020 [Chloroflexota bacterium]
MLTPDEIAANPIGTDLVYEDDAIRIWRIVLQPGEVAGTHTHLLDYTTVVVEGDMVDRPNGDGTVDQISVAPGQLMRWHQGTQEHSLKNSGKVPFRNVIVELKGAPTPSY